MIEVPGPLKQGLKPTIAQMADEIERIEVPGPLKQGLKQIARVVSVKGIPD